MPDPQSGKKIVVIGGGPAGVFAAIEAKRADPAAHVLLLTDEPCEPYEKPPLSKAVLTGKALPEHAPIAGPKGTTAHGVVLECNALVTAIGRAEREVITAEGGASPTTRSCWRPARWCASWRSCRSAWRGCIICGPKRMPAGSRRPCAAASSWSWSAAG